MKYRIEFPFHRDCDLRCYYCFHKDYFEQKGIYENKKCGLGFTFDEWNLWRNKFLKNADEILISPHGGETFHNLNVDHFLNLIKTSLNSIQTYECLSNGLSSIDNYKAILVPYSDKFKRIGFTFHRSMMNDKLKEKFEKTVQNVRDLGVNVYVKELLILDYKEDILKYKEFWEIRGIELKIQDFKGIKGLDSSEFRKYTEEDKELIDIEYRHPMNKFCSCLEGYKSVLIQGFDEFSGSIIACWRSMVVVGNIKKLTFNPNYKVDRFPGTSKRMIVGVPKIFQKLDENGNPITYPCQ
jgi:hypothetical protein